MRNLRVYRYVDAVARLGSIRKAAEHLAVTPSALNRRILALEEELGVQLFERRSRGVRLNTAGELVIHLFRRQLADVERVKSQLSDLSGLRRGHVSIACSNAVLPFFLPRQIHLYQEEHPGVTFSVQIRDGEAAEKALLEYSADLAIVFEPLRLNDFQTVLTVRQPIHAVMARDHPLARTETLRLTDCLAYPLALPSAPYAVRLLLQAAAEKASLRLEPAVESESYILLRTFAGLGQAITFEIEIGVPPHLIDDSLVSVPVELGGNLHGLLHLAQLRGRTLSVAAAGFAHHLSNVFVSEYEAV
ncbi:LysR family transcriptional regulator [Lutibaculum baratangense]|uniref:Transcriptional regulator of LysR family protein n=1 Tax=Lutibaculum baratangense AMV1 TaxID=631454 RepID=V4QYS7_9HYPH|nr:LysR family transcriptional regulator [Lutibaculum baratangense]ESR24877.1 transcriptional regulator of LysR family protein [Lutibaculum baratangense AMV1]